jgi:hypothetical protein
MDRSNHYEAAFAAYSLDTSAMEGRKVVYYRILSAPPGYPPNQKYMVAAYRTLEYASCLGGVANKEGSRFAETLEEARKMMPAKARRLPFETDGQFLELWESAVAAASTS